MSLLENISGDFQQSYSLSHNNVYLAIGDPYENVVNIYENFQYTTDNPEDKYTQLDKIFGRPGGVSGFGTALSLTERELFVGAPNANDNSGSVFCYSEYLDNDIGSTGETRWGEFSFIDANETSGYFGCKIASIKIF